MKKLSSRDAVENQYDPKGFDAEYNVIPSINFTSSNMAQTLWDLGYHDMESMTKQFKERNLPVDAEAKKIMKAVIEKMEAKTETASWKSYLKKTAAVRRFMSGDQIGLSAENSNKVYDLEKNLSAECNNSPSAKELQERLNRGMSNPESYNWDKISSQEAKQIRDIMQFEQAFTSQNPLSSGNAPETGPLRFEINNRKGPGRPRASWKSYIKKAQTTTEGYETGDQVLLRDGEVGIVQEVLDNGYISLLLDGNKYKIINPIQIEKKVADKFGPTEHSDQGRANWGEGWNKQVASWKSFLKK